ncbi:MAG: ABC transporter substrate-binding protein [Reyranella sp.]|uniref:ABC transporter substrate-binding protein n=1 Tax=Reyranella sp. TaxID=1929291 RepID=UPI0012004404|nr:ABC transporter substrate-binding protein [Reyranella sp.]TAJ91066.1 MAG: ABC transporter substrate-binding protein [Reyranella sp.]TBR30047.1 MAG: ABC transporter substrate-binding protein [Reyranella sp.]
MFSFRKSALAVLAAASVGGLMAAAPVQAQTLKVVMHSDVKILDPIWTTAYIQRNHGYMVWDTLFAMDEKFDVKPQMVDKYDVSADKLTWTFTLRDGLEWHDGKPVTAEDCVASIKRWAARDSMGQKLMASAEGLEVVDAKTFKLKMKEPYGLVLQSLGKPSSNVPFMMPKKTAETDPMQQIKIEDVIGSGPFVFKADEWKPGEKIVYVKNTKYKPRAEPPSGLSGGKVVKVDRVEWIAMPDAQTQIGALQSGEIDMIEAPGHDLLPLLAKDKNINLLNGNPTGNQYTFRFNSTAKPFDNTKVRHAVFVAFAQEDFLKATIGDPQWFKVCKAPFVCGTPLATDAGMADVLNGNAAKAKQLLTEAGYDGTPIVLMHSTDLQVLTNLAPVAKAQMERAGFKVDMVSMDWQTLVARRVKKDPPNAGGWHAFLTSWVAADILNPVMAGFFNASCDKAMFGWPCDATIEKFRDQFAKETDPAKQKQIVEDLQKYWVDHPTHINVGQWYAPLARRNNIEGNLIAPAPVFWNVSKK